jgi:hypothetical protein
MFVAKINAGGTALCYSTYLGGSGYDYFNNDIAVDAEGRAYVTGETSSRDFPTVNPLQLDYGGGSTDAFVTKLSGGGTALIYSTYLGGNERDSGLGIAVDAAGNAYVAGTTESPNYPITVEAFDRTCGTDGQCNVYYDPEEVQYFRLADAFVTKITESDSTGCCTYRVTANPSTAAAGGAITVAWGAPGGHSARDWVGLYRVGDSVTSYLAWQYTGEGESGEMTFTAPVEAGQYEFRYFTDDTYSVVATSTPVTVIGDDSSYTLTASPTTVTAGGSLSVSWTAPSGRPTTDWIGLYRVGQPSDPYTGSVWWQYTNGTTSGTTTLSAPLGLGQYEFRYFLDNGYDVVATILVDVQY